jgi:predicted RNA-binding protein with PUA-like domain
MAYWMLKSEPDVFGIDALQKQRESIWDGVRNYQARNYMRAMQIGDQAFFYHSNCEVTGIAGLCDISATGVADPTQFDPKSPYFDAKSPKDAPRWDTVKVRFVEKFPRVLSLAELKDRFTSDDLVVVRKGNRLSVMPVSDSAAIRLLAACREK